MAAKSANPTRPGRCEGEERKKALSVALANIEKQFGKGAIMRMADGAEVEDIETVSTGSLGLDLALGVGGLPRGRIIEVFGPESSGKTTLSLQVIAEMQKIGGTCAFIDAEHALDVQYAQRLGVQLSDLLISQPDTGEQALEITDALVRSGSVDLIVVDSVAALTPKSEIEGDMGDALPGLQARLMSQALRKLTGSITKTKSMVIFINQIRMKIGGYGNPETTTGGNALKFYSSVRLDIRRIGAIKKGGTRPLVEVLEEGERPTKKGFVIMDAPAPGVENLTAIVSGGCHAVIFSTGKGNCIGHPVAPVIKISGNPMTVKAMRDNIDVDVSGVINQGLTLDQATDIVQDKLVDVCWGAMTSSDMLGEIETAASRLLRTL